jgi:hypothetical protein
VVCARDFVTVLPQRVRDKLAAITAGAGYKHAHECGKSKQLGSFVPASDKKWADAHVVLAREAAAKHERSGGQLQEAGLWLVTGGQPLSG